MNKLSIDLLSKCLSFSGNSNEAGVSKTFLQALTKPAGSNINYALSIIKVLKYALRYNKHKIYYLFLKYLPKHVHELTFTSYDYVEIPAISLSFYSDKKSINFPGDVLLSYDWYIKNKPLLNIFMDQIPITHYEIAETKTEDINNEYIVLKHPNIPYNYEWIDPFEISPISETEPYSDIQMSIFKEKCQYRYDDIDQSKSIPIGFKNKNYTDSFISYLYNNTNFENNEEIPPSNYINPNSATTAYLSFHNYNKPQLNTIKNDNQLRRSYRIIPYFRGLKHDTHNIINIIKSDNKLPEQKLLDEDTMKEFNHLSILIPSNEHISYYGSLIETDNKQSEEKQSEEKQSEEQAKYAAREKEINKMTNRIKKGMGDIEFREYQIREAYLEDFSDEDIN
jgi:hypothetical protein